MLIQLLPQYTEINFCSQEKQAAKENEGVPDEEGWITVTRAKSATPYTDVNNERLKCKLKKRNQEKV